MTCPQCQAESHAYEVAVEWMDGGEEADVEGMEAHCPECGWSGEVADLECEGWRNGESVVVFRVDGDNGGS